MALEKDVVALTLGEETIVITESYEVRASVFRQPAQFAINLGHGGVAEELIRKYPPKTKFKLTVNDHTVQTGLTDGFSTGDGGGATVVRFTGRDIMARLVDSFIPQEESYQESTYLDLAKAQLKAIGLGAVPIASSNEANRKAITGSKITQTAPAVVEAELSISSTDIREIVPGTKKVVYETLKAKLGTRRYDFLKTQNDRGGLFFFAAGDGTFVLSRPTAKQTPIAKIVRQRGGTRLPGSIRNHNYRVDFTNRHTKCIVYGHGGGRNFGRSKNRGEFVDQEFSGILGGEDAQVIVVHDNDAKTPKQAEFFARRRIAEEGRDSIELTYTLPGHRVAPNVTTVWAPDTVVDVDDRELGISGLWYVEAVTFNRAPDTTSTLRLMRPQDLVFGEGLF
jgi:prophage tail gpP-like protein